ncbi:MAG: FlgD immunoglobulin-like domain containing protein [bacterium]
MKLSKLSISLLLAMIFCTFSTQAQIVITSGDIPNTIGYRYSQSCSDFTTTVNPGSAGPNQTWDLRGIPVSVSANLEIVDRSSTPNPTWFPLANLITKATGEGEYTASYSYELLTSQMLKNLGMAFAVPESSYAVEWTNEPPFATFPVEYQDSWMTRLYYEQSFMGFTMTVTDTNWITMDGWGTAIIDEGGSYSCLRAKGHHHTVTTVNGFPTSDVWTWSYSWWTSGHGQVAAMESDPDADENFTQGMFCRTGVVSDAEPVQIVPLAFELQSPYPNPFNPETVIPYSVNALTDMELAVYNALGQKVRTLVQGRTAPGSYSVIWNGVDDAGNSVGTGVYYCRLLSPQGNSPAQRLVLLR